LRRVVASHDANEPIFGRCLEVDALIAAIARFQGEDEHAALVNELEEDYRRAYAEWEHAGVLAPPTA
jgi:hypothetical protein